MKFEVKQIGFSFKNDNKEFFTRLERKFYEKLKIYASNTVIIEEKITENSNYTLKAITLKRKISLNTFNNVMNATINEFKAYSAPFISEMHYDNYDDIIEVHVD